MNFQQRFEQQRYFILTDFENFLFDYGQKVKKDEKFLEGVRNLVVEYSRDMGYFKYTPEEQAQIKRGTTAFADENPLRLPSVYLSSTLEAIDELAKGLLAKQTLK